MRKIKQSGKGMQNCAVGLLLYGHMRITDGKKLFNGLVGEKGGHL